MVLKSCPSAPPAPDRLPTSCSLDLWTGRTLELRMKVDGSPPGSPVPGILQARTLECCKDAARQLRGREQGGAGGPGRGFGSQDSGVPTRPGTNLAAL